jgi:hypothetical protein
MNVEFNQKAQLERDTHLKDLESTKVKLCEEIEQIKREHAKEISHLQTELDETKQFIEQQSLQIKGLEQAKENLEEVLEENKEKTLTLETIKAEAIDLNEKLRLEKK